MRFSAGKIAKLGIKQTEIRYFCKQNETHVQYYCRTVNLKCRIDFSIALSIKVAVRVLHVHENPELNAINYG